MNENYFFIKLIVVPITAYFVIAGLQMFLD